MAIVKQNGKTFVTDKNGKKIRRLLNPSERAKKFAHELKTGNRVTTLNNPKVDKNGEVMKLTDKQRAFRSGYLAAKQDAADAYNAKHNPKRLKEVKAARRARRKSHKKKK